MRNACQLPNGGSAPATLGFSAVAPEWPTNGAADAAPAIPAAESTLGSHPCVALSSAQVLPEWINRNRADNAFASNGNNPLNFVSRSRGSLQVVFLIQAPHPLVGKGPYPHSSTVARKATVVNKGNAGAGVATQGLQRHWQLVQAHSRVGCSAAVFSVGLEPLATKPNCALHQANSRFTLI